MNADGDERGVSAAETGLSALKRKEM